MPTYVARFIVNLLLFQAFKFVLELFDAGGFGWFGRWHSG
jgi:hypothetical protein